MVDIRPSQLPSAIIPLRETDSLIVDQGVDGVRKTTPSAMTDSVAPVATQAEAIAGTDNTKRMTSLRTKQSIASEVGVTLASNTQGAKADSAVQSVNGKSGNSVTIVKGDVGLGNVDNTSDANKPISTATQTALDAKANSSVTISAGAGLDGGGNLTANRTVSLNAASIASLAKADSAVQTVNGVSPIAGNVTVSAEEKRLQDTRTTAIAESFANNVQFVETAGYSSVGDGGGALYKRVSSEPSHAGKFQSADGAWWEIVPENGTVSVLQLGAKADGLFNNSPIFNASQSVAVAIGVKEVVIPNVGGEYLLNSQVEINQNGLVYRGVGRPRLKRNHADNSVFLRGSGNTWRDTVIYGNRSAFPASEGSGIVIWNTHNDVIGNEVYNFRGWGIIFYAYQTPVPCAWGRAIQNYVHDILSGGICTNAATDCIIGFNKTIDIGFEGITLDVYALRCTVVGNRVERSCTVDGVGAIGIDAAAHNSVVGNVITGTVVANKPGITFQNNIDVSQYNSIVGNTIDGVTGHGIHIKKGVGLNGGGTFFTAVSGNNISSVGGDAIRIDAGCNQNDISGNIFPTNKAIVDNGDDNRVQGRYVSKFRSFSASGTIGIDDENIFVNASAGNVTLTLPKVSRYGTGKSKTLRFARTDNSANAVNVVNAAGDTSVNHTMLGFSQMMLMSDNGVYWQRFNPS